MSSMFLLIPVSLNAWREHRRMQLQLQTLGISKCSLYPFSQNHTGVYSLKKHHFASKYSFLTNICDSYFFNTTAKKDDLHIWLH